MPIYEYGCSDCGHDLETIQKVSDAPLTDCPECGHPTLKKKISAAAFRFKGGGWYETDFKTGDKKNLADGGDGKKESGKDAAKSADNSKSDSSKKSESTSKSETKTKPAASSNGSKSGGGGSNKAA